MSLTKYANRRLYCNEQRKYVKVAEVRDRLLSGEPVFDNRTNNNITDNVLASMLVQDVGGGHGPTTLVLRNFIRNYSRTRSG